MASIGNLRDLNRAGSFRPTSLCGGSVRTLLKFTFLILFCINIHPVDSYKLFESDIKPDEVRIHLPTDTAIFTAGDALMRINLKTNRTQK